MAARVSKQLTDEWYVYELIDPRDGRVFYVGKGKGKRHDAHEKDAARGKPGKKCELIREIVASGNDVIKHRVKQFTNEADAYAYEVKRIAKHKLDTLTNQNKGGGAPRLPTIEQEFRKHGGRWVAAKILMRYLYTLKPEQQATIRMIYESKHSNHPVGKSLTEAMA